MSFFLAFKLIFIWIHWLFELVFLFFLEMFFEFTQLFGIASGCDLSKNAAVVVLITFFLLENIALWTLGLDW